MTRNLRYVSLFTAAQYWRHQALEHGNKPLPFGPLFRRLEAVIALASVLHHQDEDDPPSGVVGVTHASAEVSKARVRLQPGVQNFAYNIYRGSLGNQGLRLFDLTKQDDPLFHESKSVGEAWNVGGLLTALPGFREGVLPELVPTSEIRRVAGSFCLCTVPTGSAEQRALIELLLGLGGEAGPAPDLDTVRDPDSVRVASWRLLLEVVKRSEGRVLTEHSLMARLLEPEMAMSELPTSLRRVLLLWRWVAARSLFERGWTQAFEAALSAVRDASDGLTDEELLGHVKGKYGVTEPISDLFDESEQNWTGGQWLVDRFESLSPRDSVLLMISGLELSGCLLTTNAPKRLLDFDGTGDIPSRSERDRARAMRDKALNADEYWSQTAHAALVAHVEITFNKMAAGNPDSLHVEYERGRWIVPPGRYHWAQIPARGSSRFDVGLGWLEQLGLVDRNADGSAFLTRLGRETVNRWDGHYRQWR